MKCYDKVDGTYVLTRCERHKCVKALLSKETRCVKMRNMKRKRKRKKEIENFLLNHPDQ